MTLALRITLLSAVVALAGAAANANELPRATAPSSGWSFQLTPYLWASALKGDVALGPLAPPTSINASFMDIVDHLDMAFAGQFEWRNGKYGILADLSYLAASVSASGPAGFVNGNLKDKTFFGTIVGSYRAVEQGNASVELLAGGRVWWRHDELTITGLGGAQTASREKSWVDPIIGLRARAQISPTVFMQFYGDVGGFGVASDMTYQLEGIVGYLYSPTKTFFAGYRYLSVDYERGGYIFDVRMSGPIVGATFKF